MKCFWVTSLQHGQRQKKLLGFLQVLRSCSFQRDNCFTELLMALENPFRIKESRNLLSFLFVVEQNMFCLFLAKQVKRS
jgi:hypothetical protein